MLRNFEELRSSGAALTSNTIVVAAAHDEHTLNAVYAASKASPMSYILVGNRKRIMEISSELSVVPNEDAIVDCDSGTDCAYKAVALIREKRGGILMKGMLETGTLLKAVLDKETGIKERATMSHLAVLEIPAYHKLISVTDGGMLTSPTQEQKADIVRNTVEFYRRLGYSRPKIAAICAGEVVSEKIPETVDARQLQIMCERGVLGDCLLEGPISFDIAISAKSAKAKGFISAIAGDVDILLVPSITVGNVLSKGLLYWGGAKMAGCVLGASVPIVLVSRAASTEEKLLSIQLCLKIGDSHGLLDSGN